MEKTRLERTTCRSINDGTWKRVHFRNAVMQKHFRLNFIRIISLIMNLHLVHTQEVLLWRIPSSLISLHFFLEKQPGNLLIMLNFCSREKLTGLPHTMAVLFCCGTGGLLVWTGHCENISTKQPFPFPGDPALSNVIELHELSEALSISQDQTSNANQLVLQHLLGTAESLPRA